MHRLYQYLCVMAVALLSIAGTLSAQVIDPKDAAGAFGDKLAAEKPKQIYD